MSLESYLREIEEQRARDLRRGLISESSDVEMENTCSHVTYIYKRTRYGCSTVLVVALLIMVILVAVAAIKNPNQADGHAQIKSYLVERVNEFAANKIWEDTDSHRRSKSLDALIVNILAPSIVNAAVRIHTTDYVVLTTFEARIDDVNLMSGVILFGKVMPFTSDFDKDALRAAGFDL